MMNNELWYDQDDGEVMNELGMQEFEKGPKASTSLALKYLLRAEKLGHLTFRSAYYIGWIYLDKLEKPESSIEYFEKSIDKNPNWDNPFSKIGEAYLKLNMIKEALHYLGQGYNLENQSTDLLNNFGLALYNDDLLESAQKVLEECIEKDNSFYKAYNNLGNVYRKRKQYKEALNYYKQSITLSNKTHIMAYVNSASAYLCQNDLISWMENVQNWLDLNSSKAKNLLKYCGLYQLVQHPDIRKAIISFENKEFKDGIQLLKTISPKYPKNIAINWYLGLFHQKLGQDEEALLSLKSTIDECLSLSEQQEISTVYL